MSAICIVNLKAHKLEFDQLNNLANELVAFALKNKVAVFFNVRDYGYDIIQEAKMRNYFLVSDSFLYENCDFLEEPLYILERETVQKTYEAFCGRYIFLEGMLRLIFQYEVLITEIYISTEGEINGIGDFHSIETNSGGFMREFFCSVYDSQKNIFAEFETVKFIIEK